ncbi:MAG: UDP-N-acetylmuramoyl-L-alanyl-D-glutamate--2,6-diaminopimelate ligase [Leptolyngbya sp. SIO4C1]|nr:UDP-N-acetylmuramoyl-L-alanyl-D-glutamate--2,6-diaminopimelate ligase [Leptolyngbya sp. SIO4C1]
MKLRDLWAKLPPEIGSTELSEHPAWDEAVKGLCTNSHACQPGDLFIGMPGTRVDGGEFWSSAIAAGAIAALVSPQALAARPAEGEALLIPMADMTRAGAEVAAAFYGRPSQRLKMVGVTGTNGKTTTTHLIEYFLNQADQTTGLLGTLYTRWPGHQRTAVHTTPFPVELQRELSEAAAAGCQNLVMEVSSHALAQRRVWGCQFEVAVFTNLTQDHLDYHKDLDDYFEAKALLFGPDYLQGRAIVNAKDAYGQRLLERLRDRAWTYSIEDTSADLYTQDLSYSPTGVSGLLHTPVGQAAFTSPLVGQFNLENLLAAVGAALHLGVSLEQMVSALPQFAGVPGRMERVQASPGQDISVIVDYAHTPDSLDNALRAARPFISGRLICVFGCGGDRDRTKRPQMGRIAYSLSDRAIITSDNPRTEDPQRILDDVVAGIEGPLDDDQVICDRAAAIRAAVLTAQPGDGILIAGKGHEDYQILGTEKIHFDDREQAEMALKQRLA